MGGYDDEHHEESDDLEDDLRQPLPHTMAISSRFRSPILLLWGGIFGILGFILAFAVGVLVYKTERENWRGDPYASGHGYWPSTVSEMVYAWNSPQGRIFFGFCLISSVMIFASWYPFEMRNVFTGPETLNCGCFSMYWTTFRQMVPPIGLLMLICVSTVPAAAADKADDFSITVHLFGAFMMFVGYIAAELKCLEVCCKAKVQMKYLDIESNEILVRFSFMVVTLIAYVIFCVLQVVMMVAVTDKQLCCHDEYYDMNSASARVDLRNRPNSPMGRIALENTASGKFLMVKIASFTSEVIAGLALIGSHIVVWYWCEERHVTYGKYELLEVYDEEKQEEVELAHRS